MSSTSPEEYIPPQLKRVIQAIRAGTFGEKNLLMSLVGTIMNNNDWYLVSSDFIAYIEAQDKVRFY
jgi:glucan phosphorylase